MTKEQQRAVLARYGRQALHALTAMTAADFDHLLALADRRAFGEGGGFDQYGDATTRLPVPRLKDEARDELADGIFYMAFALWIMAGRPVVW